ncbi:MAG: pilus assembly protein [Candidatus Nealsonbacteria bacterium]|nr:pilus assembly protein [Candidatus Nealsonbacteria bacterium]
MQSQDPVTGALRQSIPAKAKANESSQSGSDPATRLQRRRRRRRRRGAFLVEFAVVAPVFFLLVFGMLEFGRMVMVQQILTNASREGARRAVLEQSTKADVENTIAVFLDNQSVSGATVTVTPDPLTSVGFGDPVSVVVSVPYSQVSWLPTPGFLGAKQLTAQSVMCGERAE